VDPTGGNPARNDADMPVANCEIAGQITLPVPATLHELCYGAERRSLERRLTEPAGTKG
jgi:hypothetical protein